ncbi:MAG: hypothetical protein BGN88_02230 [Clostridiales bacterium 43-6]|nr:MAG: hypothetical protein BGN88_02230 [Clostridiales bacterium 43-6]
MKRTTAIILVFILVLVGCVKTTRPQGQSPEETVQLYFSYWQMKSIHKMDSLVMPQQRGADYELNKLQSIALKSCKETKNPEEKSELSTMVYVEFEVNYKGGSGSGMENGVYHWSYRLVKETEEKDWMIAGWGAG